MKLIVFIISLLFFSIIYGYGQDKVLVLKNKISGKERLLHDGKRLKIINKDGFVLRGKLQLNDTSILLSNDEIMIGKYRINLTEIRAIKTKTLAGNIIGGTIMGIGSISLITGFFFLATMPSAPPGTQNYYMGGFVNAAIGFIGIAGGIVAPIGIIILVSGREYEAKHWDILIR